MIVETDVKRRTPIRYRLDVEEHLGDLAGTALCQVRINRAREYVEVRMPRDNDPSKAVKVAIDKAELRALLRTLEDL